jgi:hypothetical protein
MILCLRWGRSLPTIALCWVMNLNQSAIESLPAICGAVHLDLAQMRHDASSLAELAMRSPMDVKQFLTSLETTENLEPLTGTIRGLLPIPSLNIAALFAIGIVHAAGNRRSQYHVR